MNAIRNAATEIAALFIEDRSFSLALAIWLVANFLAAHLGIGTPEIRAFALAAGLVALPVAGAITTARR